MSTFWQLYVHQIMTTPVVVHKLIGNNRTVNKQSQLSMHIILQQIAQKCFPYCLVLSSSSSEKIHAGILCSPLAHIA